MTMMTVLAALVMGTAMAGESDSRESRTEAQETKAVEVEDAPPECEVGDWVCVEDASDEGRRRTVCGEVVSVDGGGEDPLAITGQDCIDGGGNFCAPYPWEPAVLYCCGYQLGAPPVLSDQ